MIGSSVSKLAIIPDACQIQKPVWSCVLGQLSYLHHDVWNSGVYIDMQCTYIDICWCPCERTYCILTYTVHMVHSSVCVQWGLVKKEYCPICSIPTVWCSAGATPTRCDGETRSGPRSADESKPKTDLCPAHWLWAAWWGGTVQQTSSRCIWPSFYTLNASFVSTYITDLWLVIQGKLFAIITVRHCIWHPPLITANVTGC